MGRLCKGASRSRKIKGLIKGGGGRQGADAEEDGCKRAVGRFRGWGGGEGLV